MWLSAEVTAFLALLPTAWATAQDPTSRHADGIHLPLRLGRRSRWKRDGQSAGISLGDAADVYVTCFSDTARGYMLVISTYNVLVQVGDTISPLVLGAYI